MFESRHIFASDFGRRQRPRQLPLVVAVVVVVVVVAVVAEVVAVLVAFVVVISANEDGSRDQDSLSHRRRLSRRGLVGRLLVGVLSGSRRRTSGVVLSLVVVGMIVVSSSASASWFWLWSMSVVTST